MKIYSSSFLLGLTIITFLIFGFLLFPQYKTYKVLREKLFLKNKEYSSLESYLKSVENVKKKLREKEQDISKIDTALPQTADAPLFLFTVERIANESGLTLKEINSYRVKEVKGRNEEQEKGIRVMEAGFSFSGTYESIRNFIASLEKNPRMIEVEEMEISPGARGKGKENILDLTIKVQTFFKQYISLSNTF